MFPQHVSSTLDQNLQEIQNKLPSIDEKGTLCILKYLREILNGIGDCTPVKKIIDANLPPFIFKHLTNTNISIASNAYTCFTNIIASTNYGSDVCKNALKMDFLQIAQASLAIRDPILSDSVVHALGNVAGDSIIARNSILECDFVTQCVCEILNNGLSHSSLLCTTTWALSNMLRGRPPPDLKYIEIYIPYLVKFVDCENDEIKSNVIWGMSYVTDANLTNFSKYFSTEYVAKVVKLFQTQNEGLMVPSIRLLGNICSGNDYDVEMVINAGAVQVLKNVMDSAPKLQILKEIEWAFSNIATDSSDHIQVLINEGIFVYLYSIAKKHMSAAVSEESIYSIVGAVGKATIDQTLYLIDVGLFEVIGEYLHENSDKHLLTVLLENLFIVVQKCNDSEKLRIRVNENLEIWKIADKATALRCSLKNVTLKLESMCDNLLKIISPSVSMEDGNALCK